MGKGDLENCVNGRVYLEFTRKAGPSALSSICVALALFCAAALSLRSFSEPLDTVVFPHGVPVARDGANVLPWGNLLYIP